MLQDPITNSALVLKGYPVKIFAYHHNLLLLLLLLLLYCYYYYYYFYPDDHSLPTHLF